MSLRFHLRVLGWIYCALACLVGLFALLGLVVHVVQGQLAQAALVVPILAGLALWWAQIGLGLLNRRRAVRLPAILIAGILMVGLNALLLLAGGPPFSTSPGWISFHLLCIGIGIYTLVVLMHPAIGQALE